MGLGSYLHLSNSGPLKGKHSMSIMKRLIATAAAVTLAGGGFIATAVPANAAGGTIDTGTVYKGSYNDSTYKARVQVNLSGIDTSRNNWAQVRSTRGGLSGIIDRPVNGVNTIWVHASHFGVAAGKHQVQLSVNNAVVGSRTITVIGKPVVTWFSVVGKTRKASKKTIRAVVSYRSDVQGLRANVFFDKKGGKKKFVKVASAKINSGSFTAKTKKKLGKGTYQIRTSKTAYLQASSSFTVKWNK